MFHCSSPIGIRVSYEKYGSGPPLVLVHGSFSDHESNWEFVKPYFETHFTVYAVARRGRGETDATKGHTYEDECTDVSAVIESLDEPVFLLGHSYGAQVALGAAATLPGRVRKLVLYEPPWPTIIGADVLSRLQRLGEEGDFDAIPMTFFHETFGIPMDELEALRASEHWLPLVADAEATLEELRALHDHDFEAERYRSLPFPVLLQIGTESPRDCFVTDALAAVLPDVRIEALPGQAHEGMTMAPEQYAQAVLRFLGF
jgi:pimeloyl-ACP methyl ester carboxylesterase